MKFLRVVLLGLVFCFGVKGFAAAKKAEPLSKSIIKELSQGTRGPEALVKHLFENNEHDLLRKLVTYEVKGSKIWKLWKDVCQQDHNHLKTVLKSVDLGFLTPEQLHHAIEKRGEGVDLTSLSEKCRKANS